MPKYLTGEKLKVSALFVSEIEDVKKANISIFLNGCFSIIDGPMDMIFDVFSEVYVRLLKSIISHFFSNYCKSYNNLNVKSCLKVNSP